MTSTLIKDLMQKDPTIISRDTTLQEAARTMGAVNCGMLPVGTADKLEGVITDRDIVLRAVAKGKDMTKEKVKDYMTPKAHYVRTDDSTEDAAALMHEENINRVLVEDEQGKPCGVLSFGRIIRKNGDREEVATMIDFAVGRRAA